MSGFGPPENRRQWLTWARIRPSALMLCKRGRSFCDRQYYSPRMRDLPDTIRSVATAHKGDRTDIFHDDAGGGAKLLNQVIRFHAVVLRGK